MNVRQLLAQAKETGLQVRVDHGNLTIRGNGPQPSQLIRTIQSRKGELIEFLQGKASSKCEESELSEESRDPIFDLPLASIPFPDESPVLPPEQRAQSIGLVMSQGKPAIGWCLQRANGYFEKFPGLTWEEQDAAAALDLLRWQATNRTARLRMGQLPK
jgi:hypothetical protein